MRDFLIFNGVNSADFGCYVANANQFDAPARDVESIKVPGMNGELTLDNGRFLNQTLTYTLYVRGNIRTNLMGFRNAISQARGYQRLEDSYNPQEFYLARFISGFEVTQSDKYRAAFNVTFDRKPQRFLKTGEDTIVVTANRSILNETDQTAKPLLRVYGTGSFSFNSNIMTISAADVYTDIDCETMDAFKGTTNKNQYISGVFPELRPGVNNIATINQIDIIPRWWRL